LQELDDVVEHDRGVGQLDDLFLSRPR